MHCAEIVERLKSLSAPETISGMARFGINPDSACGICTPALRTMAKEIGIDHVLAERLWTSAFHEAHTGLYD